jgi:PHD/YefM family antitoxin component YafN of YafNO toxin-antitoxin module
MPKIIPIKDLRDTNATYELVMESQDPVYVTKNGYGAFVMMNIESYENAIAQNQVYKQLYEAEEDLVAGRVSDPRVTLNALRARYGL